MFCAPRRTSLQWASLQRASLRRGKAAAVALLTIGVVLAGCQTPEPPPLPLPPAPVVEAPPPLPQVVQRTEQPNYFRLKRTPRGVVPVRVAILLPFSSTSADTRAVADALEHAAELALFDGGSNNIILMPRDEGASPERAAAAAQKAINDGAEIILGPLFAQTALAVGRVAKAANVPVIAFSSDRSVGGKGVYLLSFQPENEVKRIVTYAAKTGRTSFAALVPQSAYGDKVNAAFRSAVEGAGGRVTTVQPFAEKPDAVRVPARAAVTSGADAVLIAEGGAVLQAIAPALAQGGDRSVKFLGTGLWDDVSVQREPMLSNGWYAAPAPAAWRQFSDRYKNVYTTAPPRIATLAYDAMSLVSLLAKGEPYRRYTDAALTDPNGYSGVDGIFRFRDDGSSERGLAVLQVGQVGVTIVDPAPKTFQNGGF